MSVFAQIIGPFFLGIALGCFGMGIVLILSINTFTQARANNSLVKLGTAFVAISVVTNLGQTIADLYRGWQMFAEDFGNLNELLTSTPMFFISPFCGLFPQVLTQIFLLRRVVLFFSSLDLLWPWLAKRSVRYAFSIVISLAIIMSFISGFMTSLKLWKSGSLIALFVMNPDQAQFSLVTAMWLASSSAVDIVLSSALCVELWVARRELTIHGGRLKSMMTGLILVTFHGGVAVAAMQISSWVLYKTEDSTNSWCYMPMLFLPKIYTITLILSLTQSSMNAHVSHATHLPTIHQIDGFDEGVSGTKNARAGIRIRSWFNRNILGEVNRPNQSRHCSSCSCNGEDEKNVHSMQASVPTLSHVGSATSASKSPHSAKQTTSSFRPADENSVSLPATSTLSSPLIVIPGTTSSYTNSDNANSTSPEDSAVGSSGMMSLNDMLNKAHEPEYRTSFSH